MAVVAVYSSKGGVGKTTISSNLAWCSAQRAGHRSLLWDLDQADGAGYMFRLDAPRRKQARSLFAGDADVSALICPTSYAWLDVLPSDGSLRELDSLLQRLGQRQRLATMAKQVMRAAMLVSLPLPPSPLSARAFDHVSRKSVAGRCTGRRWRPIPTGRRSRF